MADFAPSVPTPIAAKPPARALLWLTPEVWEIAATVGDLRKLIKRARKIAIRVHNPDDWVCIIISRAAITKSLKYRRDTDKLPGKLDLDGWLWIGA